jgi:hypothetical protein
MKRTPLKRTPFKKKGSKLKPVSDKRAIENKTYSTLRKVFLEGKMCAVYPHLRATEVHHTNKRNGERLNDLHFWLAVSREGHEYIHANPIESKEKGWLL